jgi:uncharacterized protein (TIGR00255 family)
MSIISMTGYGKSESQIQGCPCTIEVRSVNNRFLDINCRLPKNLMQMETPIKETIRKRITRGSLSVSIAIGQGEKGNIPVSYSDAAVEAFVRIADEIKEKYHLEGEVRLEQVLALPDVLQYSDSSEETSALEAHLLENLNIALDSLTAMRKKEGANLALDLKIRVERMDKILDQVKILDPQRITDWRNKFQDRIKSLMGDAELDPVRVLQEASIIADRLDINEEITRFKSHNKLFLAALEEGFNQGKKLNFILQEMGREANTLGTKCQNAEIAAFAIQLKDEVETIREQVMNIE